MKKTTHTVIIAVPETWTGLSYHRVTVQADDEEEAKEKALEAYMERDYEFLGSKMHESQLDDEAAEIAQVVPWEFEPGQVVMKKHIGPGVHPDVPVTILKRMIPGGHVCNVCGIGRGRDSMANRNAYWVNYPTGSTGIVDADLLKPVEKGEEPHEHTDIPGDNQVSP
jgi:hypothetical protein